MPQVSRPLLIALVAVVGFAGVWMTVLKKHAPSSASPPQAPGVKGLVHDVKAAHGAVAAANHAANHAAGVTKPAPAAATGRQNAAHSPVLSPTTAAPAPKPRPVAAPAATTTVLLFAGAGADDAAARQVVRSIHGPHVKTIVAPLSEVGRYAPLLGAGVQVDAAPSIYVIGPDRSAQEIVGLPDRDQVEAAVASVSPRR